MHLGLFAVRRGQFAEAQARFLDALMLAQSAGNTHKVVGILSNLGALAYDQGALAEAKPYLQQAYELALAGGYGERACGALVNLVALCIDEGSIDEAEQYLPGALELARATNHRYLLALALQNDPDAASWYSSVLQVAQRAGMQTEEGEALLVSPRSRGCKAMKNWRATTAPPVWQCFRAQSMSEPPPSNSGYPPHNSLHPLRYDDS